MELRLSGFKRILIFFHLVFLCSLPLKADSIQFDISKYELTAKIWGFLKYYHPHVAGGGRDWDQDLFKIIDDLESINNYDNLSLYYEDFLHDLGPIEEYKFKGNDTIYFNENFDLSWIENSQLSSQLKQQLRHIELYRFQGNAFYVNYAPTNNFVITNERTYPNEDYVHKKARLLSLFRYWNIIEYFYPYKYLLDNDWSKVLSEMTPLFLKEPDSEADFKSAIELLVANIDDTHAWVNLGKVSNRKSFPYKLKIINDSCVIAGNYNKEIVKKESLRNGDVLISVNERDIYEIVDNKLAFKPASNLNRKKLFLFEEALQSDKEKLRLEIRRGKELMNMEVNLYASSDFNYHKRSDTEAFRKIGDSIGYVNLRLLNIKAVKPTMKALSNSKGIIFDLRGYPNNVFYQISSYLNSVNKPFAKALNPALEYPGKFKWGNTIFTRSNKKKSYKGKVIVLVDEESLSRAEFAAMCLAASDNALVVGSQTAAADGTVSIFEFALGYKTAVSGKGIYYNDNSLAQRVGVKIDVEVYPTINGLKQNKDEVLLKAIELINE